jgi:hypothetical protein
MELQKTHYTKTVRSKRNKMEGQSWWHTPVIPSTQEVEMGGSLFDASLSKNLARPYIKNKLKAKEPRCDFSG